MEIKVLPHGKIISAQVGDNLLQRLVDSEIPVSYSCRAGRCGTCRCKVISGQVQESGREAKVTNPHEMPYVLACMATVTDNCEIEIPEPDEVVIHPARILRAEVVAKESLTHDVRHLVLKPNRGWSFSPGQYANLQFTPDHIRPYSMAGLCDEELIDFHIRLVPGGRVTSYIENDLKVGDRVRVSGPLGTAYLRQKHEGPIICVAGGTGLAPVLSIMRGISSLRMENQVHVYFGVRTEEDVYGLAWLEELQAQNPNMHINVVVQLGSTKSVNSSSLSYRQGLVTDAVVEDWADLKGWRGYLCGSPPMVEAATLLLRRRGVQQEHVHADAFYSFA